MRFRRFSRLARCGCVTRCSPGRALAGDFIACVFDHGAQGGGTDAAVFVFDRGLFALERHIDLAHTVERFQYALHARNAAATRHAFDAESDGFHSMLLAAFQRFNNRELLTTDTELSAIAPPAITGLSRPTA